MPFFSVDHILVCRGNSGLYPEGSLGGYLSAVEAGADYLECEIQFSADLVPLCLHDYYLSRVTDIPEKTRQFVVILLFGLLSLRCQKLKDDVCSDAAFSPVQVLRRVLSHAPSIRSHRA